MTDSRPPYACGTPVRGDPFKSKYRNVCLPRRLLMTDVIPEWKAHRRQREPIQGVRDGRNPPRDVAEDVLPAIDQRLNPAQQQVKINNPDREPEDKSCRKIVAGGLVSRTPGKTQGENCT